MPSELDKAIQRETLTPQYPYMPREEWKDRIARARALMTDKGLDALMLVNSQNHQYFFGSAKTYKNVYPAVGIVPRLGPTAAAMESADALVLEAQGYAELNVGYRGDTQAPTPTASEPVKLISELMNELGLTGKTVGMEFGQFMWWDGFTINEWERLKKEMPDTTFVDATELIWELRTIKSPWEMEVMRHLHQVTAKGYRQIINNAAPGMNERQLLYDALKFWIDEGIVESTNYTLNCMNAIQPFRDRTLNEGDWIMLDGGPTYKGYCADIQRFIKIGKVSPDFEKAARLASEAMWAVEEILKPGVTAGQIWETSYATIAKKVPDIWRTARSRRMVGWVGHGIGLNIHEPPYFVEGSEAILKEGMVVAVEVPSYHERAFANMPEDTYIITKDGYEKLSMDLGPTETYVRT
jgi:Xaa-Pro aminopeptidase